MQWRKNGSNEVTSVGNMLHHDVRNCIIRNLRGVFGGQGLEKRHATAIRVHLNNISEPPSLEHAPDDVYNLFEKLHDLREYIRNHQQ